MKKLLPNPAKLLPKVSIAIIAASPDCYNTTNGKIAIKYKRRNRVSRVVSVEFVQ